MVETSLSRLFTIPTVSNFLLENLKTGSLGCGLAGLIASIKDRGQKGVSGLLLTIILSPELSLHDFGESTWIKSLELSRMWTLAQHRHLGVIALTLEPVRSPIRLLVQ